MLSANWDAAGMSGDNAFLTKDGQIMRLDNGGAFLMRAQKGRRKDDHLLDGIGEIETFFPGSVSNPGYHALAKQAGYASVEDFKADFTKQVQAISALKQQYGGFKGFVKAHAPGFEGKDADRIVQMLDARSKALADLVVEMNAPAPPKPALGAMRWRANPVKGVKPRADLKIADLPEARVIADHSADRMAWGEDRADYQARAKKSIKDIGINAKSAVEGFTNGTYDEVRESEEKGRPNKASKDLSAMYAKATPEPITTFRGIKNLPESTVNAMIRNDGVFRLGKNNTGATSSTAHNPRTAKAFMWGDKDHPEESMHKVFFHLHQKSGVAIETISSCGVGENEVLVAREAEFKVVSIARMKGSKRVVIIELEEI